MELYKVSQKDLQCIAQEKGAIRTGSTVDPNRRARDYVREDGYRGKMYVAETTNMMRAEDKLLNTCPCKYNDQRLSNHKEKPGYVYVIKGRKMN